MQNKKVLVLIFIFIPAFVLVYWWVANNVFNKKQNIPIAQNEKEINLPELKCDFESDQAAYNEASDKNSLDACSCIKDEKAREMCLISTMDTILYSNALDNLNVEICENIKSQVHKDSCYSVVEDSIAQLKEKDPARLAYIFTRTHNENSIALYEKLTVDNPDDVNNYIALALAYAEKGLREDEQGDDQTQYVEKAFAAINKAKSIDANNSEVYRVEAYINEIKPDYDQAKILYGKAIEIDGNNASAYAGRGHVNRLMGMLDLAVEDFNKAAELDINKENVFVYVNLCNLESSRSNFKEAVKNCSLVTENNEADPNFKSEAHQIMANIFMGNNDLVQARNNLLKAKSLTPKDAGIFIAFSKLNIIEKKYQESLENAQKSVELSPNKATSYLALAQALYMEERYQESIEAAQKGLSLVKDDVSLLTASKPAVERVLNNSIANCYRQMGDADKQTEYEQKAQESFSN